MQRQMKSELGHFHQFSDINLKINKENVIEHVHQEEVFIIYQDL